MQNYPSAITNAVTPPPAPLPVMLDVETLGTTPGSVIKSIGAVRFGIIEGKHVIKDSFYRRIDAQSCIAAGLTMDAATVEWWMAQNDAARAEMTKPGEPLKDVLRSFDFWLEPDCEVWGNGAAFDNVILASAAAAVMVPAAWAHRKSMCYRTMKNTNRHIQFVRQGVYHNALDDAASQALHLMQIWSWQAKQVQAMQLVKVALSHSDMMLLNGSTADIPPDNLVMVGNWLHDAHSIVTSEHAEAYHPHPLFAFTVDGRPFDAKDIS